MQLLGQDALLGGVNGLQLVEVGLAPYQDVRGDDEDDVLDYRLEDRQQDDLLVIKSEDGEQIQGGALDADDLVVLELGDHLDVVDIGVLLGEDGRFPLGDGADEHQA